MSDPDQLPPTRADALSLALDAYEALALVGEEVADEWIYVSALADAGRARLTRAAGQRPELPLARTEATAVAAAAAEVHRIADPHRAIDWLSTFPAVVELALGAAPGSRDAAPSGRDAGETGRAGGTGRAGEAGAGPGA